MLRHCPIDIYFKGVLQWDYMLSSEDIKNLIKAQKEVFITKGDFEAFKEDLFDVFPTKEDAVTKDDFEVLRRDFTDLQSSVDSYAKKADTYFQEMLMLTRRIDRIEKWMKELADKVGIKLEY